MRRLRLILVTIAAILLLGGCAATSLLLGRDMSFTAAQLQSQLSRNFPKDYRKLGGLVSFTLLNPRLSLPGGGRLQVDFDVGVGGLAGGDGRTPAGHFALQSGLRFDPGTRGLHLDQPQIVRVDVPALGGAMNDSARSMLNSWLLDYARQEPVYRLDDSSWGRIAGSRIDRVDIDPGVVTLRLQ